jgi:hypothetical protein
VSKSKITYEQACETRIPFGKYRGETLNDIYIVDEKYLEWVLDSLTIPSWLEDAIVMMISDGRVGSIR